jgi:hypothetical protein
LVLQVLPIAISVLAALISSVSAWNSSRQVRIAERTRFGELVDGMSEANYDHDTALAANDEILDEGAEAAFNARQEILVRQALDPLPRIRRKVSSLEHLIIATALEHLYDRVSARRRFEIAVEAAAREGVTYQSAALQEVGNFLFLDGDKEEGSKQLQRAVEVLPEPKGDRLVRRHFYLHGLRAVQHAAIARRRRAADE